MENKGSDLLAFNNRLLSNNNLEISTMLHLSFITVISLIGCGDESQSVNKSSDANTVVTPENKVKIDPPNPVQDPLTGEAGPSLLVTQAWFWKDENGDSQPGPARLEIWRTEESGWKRFRIEDGDSNVFHKAITFGEREPRNPRLALPRRFLRP